MRASDRYLEAAKTEELTDKLKKEGFEVQVEAGLGSQRYDIIAKQGTKVVVYEVKSGSTLGEDAKNLALLRANAQQNHAEFRLVVVSPPKETDIEFEELEEILTSYASNHLPSELAELSGNTQVEWVSDIQIDVIRISKTSIYVAGNASISVELEYGGGDEKDGMTTSDSFPLEFALDLDHQFKIMDVETFDVDNSSFYE